MAFLTDAFNDAPGTALASHVADSGATYALHPSYSGLLVVSDANRIRQTTSTTSGYISSASPSNANYRVRGRFYKRSATDQILAVAGRMDAAANSMYLASYRDDTDNWLLRKAVAGVFTALGSEVPEALTLDQEYIVDLLMEDDQISLLVNEVLKIGPITDSAITAAGKVGIRNSGSATGTDTTGIHLASLEAYHATSISEDNYSFPMRVTAEKRIVTVYA